MRREAHIIEEHKRLARAPALHVGMNGRKRIPGTVKLFEIEEAAHSCSSRIAKKGPPPLVFRSARGRVSFSRRSARENSEAQQQQRPWDNELRARASASAAEGK